MAFQPLSGFSTAQTSGSTGGFKPLSGFSPTQKPTNTGGFQPLSISNPNPKPVSQPNAPKLDIGKAFASGGLQIDRVGSNLPKDAQKQVNDAVQQRKNADNAYNKVVNLPEFKFAEDEKLYKPFGFAKPAAQFVAGVGQGLLNTPQEAFKGAASLGKHQAVGDSTWQQQAGDIAAMAQLPLLIASFGTSSIAKEGVVQTVKEVAKKSAVDALKTVAKHTVEGAGYGLLGGIQSGRDITNLKDYGINLLKNIGVGAGIGGSISGFSHVVIPLSKDATNGIGAVFLKNADKRPIVTKIELDPRVAVSSVTGDTETAFGKEVRMASAKAIQTDSHIAIIPDEHGKVTTPNGDKVNIEVVAPYEPEVAKQNDVTTFEKNISDYRANGGVSEGTRVEDAALRDIAKEADLPHVKEYTQEKVQKAIKDGKLKVDDKGDVTLYRGGEPSSKNKLMSASYDKEHAQIFADNAKMPVTEIKVKPSEIKAFIGKAEGEVLLKNPKIESGVAEPTLSDTKITKSFDVKGKDIAEKKVAYNSKDSQAVQKVFSEKLSNIVGETKTQEEAISKVTSMLNEVTTRMKYDRRGLAGIRTAIQNEIKGLAGIGEGKVNYEGIVKAMYDDPDIGKYVEFLETKKVELDNKILKTPEAPPPQLLKEQKASKGVAKESSPTTPVGTGKLKESKAYQRLVDHLEVNDPETFNKVKDDPKLLYNAVNQKYDFENAAKIVEEDPQKAYRIAKQYENAPTGQRWESVNIVLADRALKEKNYAMWKDLEQSRSLAQTRAGQGIVAERGRFSDNSPHHFVQQVLDERLTRLGKTVTDTIDMSKDQIKSAKTKAVAKIDQQVKKAIDFTSKQKKTIDFAQKFLDNITCK